jgi:hypothetical protein
MGCDYYIVTLLQIEYDGGFHSIELNRQSCWWGDYPYDTDDPNQPGCEKYYEQYLKTDKKPIVLFDNGQWRTEALRDKYETMITLAIGQHTLTQVIKTESRYARQ